MEAFKNKIWKTFIKDHENIRDLKVREGYTRLTGALGIIVNTVLCVIKIVMGLVINSVAVMADGLHDLADSAAAVITLVAARMASAPPDKDHPYGHGRIEYLSSLVVSAIVLIVAFELMKTSVLKVLHPEETAFSWLTVGLLVLAIVIKGSSALFIIATGKHINSMPIIAVGTDNRNDVISSVIIVIGMLIQFFTGFNLDGYLGCIVSLFIFHSGFELIKETVGPLLGEPPEPEMVENLEEIILAHPEVNGVHDMIVYSYGPGKHFVSFHAEVDGHADFFAMHDVIDNIESEIWQKMKIIATCHMDPIDYDNPLREQMEKLIPQILAEIDGAVSYHDLRIVPGETHTNIIFDVLLEPDCRTQVIELREFIQKRISEVNEKYKVVVKFDRNYL